MHSKTKEIEEYLITKREFLIGAKISFLILLLSGLAEAVLQNVQMKKRFKLTWEEWWVTQIILVLIVCIPFIFMPLYKFILDRKMNKFIWNIKSGIFITELKKYNTEYQIIINRSLPEIDINLLKLEKGLVSFVYGDDLIVGTINNVRFRLSEMHSNGFIKRYFDGVIIVLVFEKILTDYAVENAIKSLPSNIQLKHFENKIYLLASGDEKLFELKIKKNKANTKELIEDHQFFQEILEVTNHLSITLNEV